jgi:hypothetical protein
MPTAGHSSAKSEQTLSQCSPPSWERKTAAGQVPANIVSESSGSMVIRQTRVSFIGESSRSNDAPRSRLMYTPSDAAA